MAALWLVVAASLATCNLWNEMVMEQNTMHIDAAESMYIHRRGKRGTMSAKKVPFMNDQQLLARLIRDFAYAVV